MLKLAAYALLATVVVATTAVPSSAKLMEGSRGSTGRDGARRSIIRCHTAGGKQEGVLSARPSAQTRPRQRFQLLTSRRASPGARSLLWQAGEMAPPRRGHFS